MIYGYARCSTNEKKQDIDRQKRELKKLGVKRLCDIFWEYGSGSKADRIELNKLLNIMQSGDVIIATEVSRLTRSSKHLFDIIDFVKDKHLKLIVGTFVVDCTTSTMDPMTKAFLQIAGIFAELERDITVERIKSGIENARAKGKKLGRPQLTVNDIPSSFMKYYAMYKNKELNITEISRLSQLSRNTIYKYIDILDKCKA